MVGSRPRPYVGQVRILFVSQYYPPETCAPAVRVSELAERWVAAGHDVCVLTGFPHHPAGVVAEPYRGRTFMVEQVRGVEVVRTFVYATANAGVIKRSLAYASFATSSVLLGPWARAVRRCDLVIATSPQFLCAYSGWLLSRLFSVPFVLEVRDLWPQSIVDLGVWTDRHPAVVAMRHMERFIYEQADLLVSVTDSFVDTWQAQGVDVRRAIVVKNGVDLQRFQPVPQDQARSELGWPSGETIVSYVGTHGLAQGLDDLLALSARFRDSSVRFVFAGDGAERERLDARVKTHSLNNVEFLGPQPRELVPKILGASDLVAVTLRDRPVFTQVIPSKLFEIMACGRPILLGVAGEAARMLERAGAGWAVEPQNTVAMQNVVEVVRRDPMQAQVRGAAGRAFVELEFDRDVLARRYLEQLTILDGTTDPQPVVCPLGGAADHP